MIKSSFIRKCLFIAFMGNVVFLNIPILAAAEIDQEEISPDFEYEIYAKENNVSISEAKERFLAMNEVAEITDILTSKYSNFASSYIEHDPTFEIVFNFKQDSLIPSEFDELIKDKSWASRSTIRRVKYSLSDLKSIQNQVSQALDTYEGAEYLLAIDVKENQVRADIPPEMAMKMSFRNNTERAASPIPQGVKLNYVNKLPQPVSYGGNALMTPVGGTQYSMCTSGFVVKNSTNVLGLVTAAHCGAASTYWSYAGSPNLLPILGRILTRDVEWFKLTPALINQA